MWRYASWLPADETFSLLASQPNIGWHVRLRTPALGTLRMFRVAGFERMPFSTGRWKTGWIYSASSHGSRKLQALLRRREEIE